MTGLAIAGFAILFNQNAPAQTNAAPPPASPQPPSGYPAPQPPMGYPGQPPGRFRGPGAFLYQRAINDLTMVKREMLRAPDDLGGHRDSAVAACDKALEELHAVQAIVQARPPRRPPMAPPMAPPSAPAPPPATPPSQ